MKKILLKTSIEYGDLCVSDAFESMMIMTDNEPTGIEDKYVMKCDDLMKILAELHRKAKMFIYIPKSTRNNIMSILMDMDFYIRTMLTMDRYEKYARGLKLLHLSHRDIAYCLCGIMSEAKLEDAFANYET